MAESAQGAAVLPVEGWILAVIGIDHTLASARLSSSRSQSMNLGAGTDALYNLSAEPAPLDGTAPLHCCVAGIQGTRR